MKIERISDSQIKCVLSKADLKERNINASELAYGTEKANNLFREMAWEANKQFGFETGDMPLMIEAIPLSNESLALIITKVDDPEELDTRFSKFSPTKEDLEDAAHIESQFKKDSINKANEILNLMDSFKKALLNKQKNKAATDAVSDSQNNHNEVTTDSSQYSDAANHSNTNGNIIMIYTFLNMDSIIELSHIICDKYDGVNSLYLDAATKRYYLVLEQSSHSPEEFNQICNMICEYGEKSPFFETSESYFAEHFECILKSNALQELNNISIE